MAAAIVWIPYCGVAPFPAEIWSRWNWDPWLMTGLVAAAALYRWCSSARPDSAGRMPGSTTRESEARVKVPSHNSVSIWASAFAGVTSGERRLRRAPFAAAWLLLCLLFVSPVCALASALFSARVVHHVLLVAVAAPALVAAFPARQVHRRGALAWATAAQAIVFWVWHAPPAYAWALSSHAAYWLMQLSLFGIATVFWATVRRASAPAAIGALLATMVQMGLLGALITFASRPLFAPHLVSTAAWGYSPLEDQQLAGLVMWAPAAGLYLGAALWLLSRWIGPDAKRALPG